MDETGSLAQEALRLVQDDRGLMEAQYLRLLAAQVFALLAIHEELVVIAGSGPQR